MSSKAGADTKTPGQTVLDISGQVNDPKGTYSYVARFSVVDTAMVTGKTLTYDKSSTDLSGALLIPITGGAALHPGHAGQRHPHPDQGGHHHGGGHGGQLHRHVGCQQEVTRACSCIFLTPKCSNPRSPPGIPGRPIPVHQNC